MSSACNQHVFSMSSACLQDVFSMSSGCLKDVFRKTSGRLQEEMQIFVCLMKSVLELTIFIFLAQIKHVAGQSKDSLRTLNFLNILCLIQSEPKILRLVFKKTSLFADMESWGLLCKH